MSVACISARYARSLAKDSGLVAVEAHPVKVELLETKIIESPVGWNVVRLDRDILPALLQHIGGLAEGGDACCKTHPIAHEDFHDDSSCPLEFCSGLLRGFACAALREFGCALISFALDRSITVVAR